MFILKRLLGEIEYNPVVKNSKQTTERVMSMCFVPGRYLLISTETGTYYVKVNIRKMLKLKETQKTSGNTTVLEKLDENFSNDKAKAFMMNSDNGKKE